jgi:DNA-directed RNA polymerase specialized sigma24 family protein
MRVPLKIDNREFSALLAKYQRGDSRASDRNRLAVDFFYPIARKWVSERRDSITPAIETDDLVAECVCICWLRIGNCDPTKNCFSYFSTIAINAITRVISQHDSEVRRRANYAERHHSDHGRKIAVPPTDGEGSD